MNLLKEVLNKKGISQTQLAKMMGSTKQHVSGIYHNKVQPLKTLRHIAEILDIDVRELIAPTKTIEEKTNQLNNISKELERSQIAIKKAIDLIE